MDAAARHLDQRVEVAGLDLLQQPEVIRAIMLEGGPY